MEQQPEKAKLIRITTVPQSLWKLLDGQLKFMNKFYQVYAVSSPGKELDWVSEMQEVSVFKIPMERGISPFKDLVSLWKMYWFIRRIGPDIVHSHTPKAGLLSMIAARIAGVKLRLHTVAGMPLEVTTGLKRWILLRMEQLTYACATAVYPNSVGLLRFIESNQLASMNKVRIIGRGSSNGINSDYFNANISGLTESARSLRASVLDSDKDFTFGFAGRITKDKGVNELIEAFLSFKLDHPNAHLLIAGKIEMEANPIHKDAMHHIMNDPNIHYLGYQKDIRPFMMASDIFLFPSYREGLPNVLLQALSLERPTIATNVTGNSDIIEDGVNGLLIMVRSSSALLESMTRLYNDPELRVSLSKGGRSSILSKYSQEFVWKSLLQEYEAQLTSTINE